MMVERGDLVDRATDVVERMLDDVVAVPPTDDKGAAIVPDWEADYRTYLADRRAYADVLRAGRNEAFTETAVDGIPLSDKLRALRRRQRDALLRAPHRSLEAPESVRIERLHLTSIGSYAEHRMGRQRSSLTTRAGLPAATTKSGISPRTTLLAPITTWRPIVAPGQHHRAVTEPRARRRCAPAARASPAARSERRGPRSRGSGR